MLLTVGYEGRTQDGLIDLVDAHGARRFIDVRLRASSRKPGFGKTSLSAALRGCGIEYVHEPTLGNPRDNRKPFNAGAPAALARYEDVLSGVGAAALDRVIAAASDGTVAIMCFEHDHRTCHRDAIAHHAADAGLVVVHL